MTSQAFSIEYQQTRIERFYAERERLRSQKFTADQIRAFNLYGALPNPLSNTGGMVKSNAEAGLDFVPFDVSQLNPKKKLSTVGTQYTECRKRKSQNKFSVHLDWLEFSLPRLRVLKDGILGDTHPTQEEDVDFLLSLLGLVQKERQTCPIKFYRRGFDIIDPYSRTILGVAAYDNYTRSSNKCHLSLNSDGCAFLSGRGEDCLRDFLLCFGGEITRVDLAHDLTPLGEKGLKLSQFKGKTTSSILLETLSAYMKGEFFGLSKQGGSRKSSVNFIGPLWNDSSQEHEEGSTLYIGKRSSGKCLRVYEKAKQLGDPSLFWVRYEVEYRNRDREIPLDILDHKQEYFTGAYPFLERFCQGEPKRIWIKKKERELELMAALGHCKRSYGPLLGYMREHTSYSDTQVLDLVSRYKHDPKFYDCQNLSLASAEDTKLGLEYSESTNNQVKAVISRASEDLRASLSMYVDHPHVRRSIDEVMAKYDAGENPSDLVWDDPSQSFSLDEDRKRGRLKENLLSSVRQIIMEAKSALTKNADPYTLSGWLDKAARARRVLSDSATESDLEILAMEATRRGLGETSETLAALQDQKSLRLARAVAVLDGTRKKAESDISRSSLDLDEFSQSISNFVQSFMES